MERVITERDFAELIRSTQFGSIRGFQLLDGSPVIDDDTEISVEYKLSGIESPKEVIDTEAFLRRPQVRTMYDRFRQLGNGVVECLDVRDGLPFKMVVRHKAQV